MDTPARVAIIVRTKDRPVLLRRAVADVLAQTYTAWHLCIVNDVGDPAKVDAVVAGFGDRLEGRVQVLHRSTSAGMEDASNAGLDATASEFVAIHDDDDTWAPEFLARTVAHLDAHPADSGVVVRTDIVLERLEGDAVTELGRESFWPDLPAISLADLLRTNRFVPISLLYRRAVHDTVGTYRTDLPVVGDWDFHLRLLAHFDVGLIKEVLAFWHQRPAAAGNASNSVLAGADLHDRYDLFVRDEHLKSYVRDNGMGSLLYLTGYIQGEFDHLHQRLNHVEHLLAEASQQTQEVGFTALLRRKYHGLRSRLRRD